MSDAFLEDLGMSSPDIYLDVKSGSHGEQTGRVVAAMVEFTSPTAMTKSGLCGTGLNQV